MKTLASKILCTVLYRLCQYAVYNTTSQQECADDPPLASVAHSDDVVAPEGCGMQRTLYKAWLVDLELVINAAASSLQTSALLHSQRLEDCVADCLKQLTCSQDERYVSSVDTFLT